MSRCIIGLEKLLVDPPQWTKTARIGLLTHPPAVDTDFTPSVLRLAKLFGDGLVALFGPQHGFWGDKQDNMIESSDSVHPLLNVKVFSLYGQVRQPTYEMLEGIDVMVVDLQDVGTRVYTYIQTLYLVLEACGQVGIKVVVLDRPNPIGRACEGNLMAEACQSFVGLFPLPMRHGLTMGEMAVWITSRHIDCEVEIVTMDNYDPHNYFDATGLPWVMPSPNMPTLETAVVYPGQVMFEGLNVSEGRGTTRPFEIVGAPFIKPFALTDRLQDYDLPGAVFRPIVFEPTFHKFAGQACGGVFIHVTNREIFKPYRTSLALVQAMAALWPEDFAFKDPPYEYEFERRPMDLILGDSTLADQLIRNTPLEELEAQWDQELSTWETERQGKLIY